MIYCMARQLYNQNPDAWTGYGNLHAGRICAIIGIVTGSLISLFVLLYFLFIFGMFFTAFAPFMEQAY